jgi:hypothetical protein
MYHALETRYRGPILGAVLFAGFFAGLLWLLSDVANAILAVLKAR